MFLKRVFEPFGGIFQLDTIARSILHTRKPLDSIFLEYACLFYHPNFKLIFPGNRCCLITQFNKENIKLAIRHLIREFSITIGDRVFIQTIGIPMGIDHAPFFG